MQIGYETYILQSFNGRVLSDRTQAEPFYPFL